MSLATEEETLALWQSWVGRRVIIVAKNSRGEGVEVDGELQVVHERGLMVRPKGRTTPEMISVSDVDSIELYDEKPKPIASKRIADVAFGNIRQHLADRHGLALSEINEPTFTEAKAYDFHLEEHTEGAEEMSHYHE